MAEPSLRRALLAVLEGGGWAFDAMPDRDGAVLAVSGDNGEWNCLTVVDDEERYLAIVSVTDHEVGVDRRPAVAEWVCRTNTEVLEGGYDLVWDDGVVRFKTSLALAGADAATVTEAVLAELVAVLLRGHLATFDQRLPELTAVLTG